MYCLTDQQVEYILNDIRRSGVEMEDLQLNLLDHICCKVEQELGDDGDFERFYKQALKELCHKSLYEIEEETINLLTFKYYHFMKKAMMISGGVATVVFVSGCLFKLMHWPGASVLILLGIVLMSLVFLPLAIILKGKEPDNTAKDRLVLVSGAISGVTYYMATLFTVMHWPGSSALWFTAVGISLLVFIPAYYLTNIGKPEKKVNTVFVSVLLVGAVGLNFTMLRVRKPVPVQVYSYLKNEELLKTVQRNTPPQQNEIVTEINQECADLKVLVLQNEIGKPAIPANFEEQKIQFSEDHMGGFFTDNKPAAALLGKLRVAIDRYNTAEADDNKIPIAHSVIDAGGDRNELFTNLSLLNTLTQIQMHVALAQPPKTAVAAR